MSSEFGPVVPGQTYPGHIEQPGRTTMTATYTDYAALEVVVLTGEDLAQGEVDEVLGDVDGLRGRVEFVVVHFRADAELRGRWVLWGEPALVDSSSPRYGEKASYYSAVCLESGEVEWMELEGNSNAGTSETFLRQLRERHFGPLNVIWDNAPAHRGEAVREYLRRPGLGLRLVNLPGYSPDFNADEAIWGWAREEATGNLCLGSRAAVQERVGSFLAGLASRKDKVKHRCRTVLQSKAEALVRDSRPASLHPANAHPTLALV